MSQQNVLIVALILSGCGVGTFDGGPAGHASEGASLFNYEQAQVDDCTLASQSNPSLFYNRRELCRINKMRDEDVQPWAAQYKKIRSHASASSQAKVYNGTQRDKYVEKFRPDAEHALKNALVYALTGEADFGTRARSFLVEWAKGSLTNINSINEFPTHYDRTNIALELSIGFTRMAAAYDLLRSTGVLNNNDKSAVKKWFAKGYDLIAAGTLYWSHSCDTGTINPCHRFSNHVTAHMAGLVTLAYAQDNRVLAEKLIFGHPGAKIVLVDQVSHHSQSPGTGELSTVALPRWTDLLKKTIYMKGDPVLGCDKNSGNPTFTGEAYDRYRHFDAPDSNPLENKNRGYGYSLVTAINLAIVAEVAYHQGLDLYHYTASTGEGLIQPSIYYAKYKRVLSPGDRLIENKGFKGEVTYVNELMRDGYNTLFELAGFRYHNHRPIVRALENYSDNKRVYFDTLFFGKSFDRSAVRFDFLLDDVTEGWTVIEDVAAAWVASGELHLRTTGNNPNIVSPTLNLDAGSYALFEARLRVTPRDPLVGDSATTTAKLFWRRKGDQGYSEARSANVLLQADGSFYRVSLNLSKNPSWTGTILGLRLRPASHSDLDIDIDSLALRQRVGRADLVRGYGADKLSVFVNYSKGTGFGSGDSWTSAWKKPRFMAVGDTNGDGRADLVRGFVDGAGKLNVYVNFSNGSAFTTGGVWASGWSTPRFLTAADVNGDGRADLVRGFDDGAGKLNVYVNFSKGSAFGSGGVWASGWSTPRFLTAADMDGDGLADLVRGFGNEKLTVYVNPSDGSRFSGGRKWAEGWAMPQFLTAGNVDGK